MSHWRRTSHHKDRRRYRLVELDEQARLEEQAVGPDVPAWSAAADEADEEDET